MGIRFLVLDLVIKIAVLFNDVLKKNDKKGIFAYIIQAVFCIPLSLMLGFILWLMGVTILIFLTKWQLAISLKFFLPVSFYIFVCLNFILTLNFRTKDFNLPRLTLKFIALLVYSQATRTAKRITLSIFVVSTLLSICIIMTVIYLNPPELEQNYGGIIIFAIVITLLTSIFIYSEASVDQAERSRRQIILWLILFMGLMLLSFLQLKLLINGQANAQNFINIGLLVIGLAFNMTTIADKGRAFYTLLNDLLEQVTQYWIDINGRWSLSYVTDVILQYKQELAITTNEMKGLWNHGNRLRFFSILSLFVLPPLIGISIILNKSFFDIITYTFNNYLSSLILRLSEFWITIFHGDRQVASIVFLLIIVSSLLIWSAKDTIRNFSSNSLKDKTLICNEIEFFADYFINFNWLVV